MSIENVCLIIVLGPLVGSILSGIFRKALGKKGAHSVTIAGILISFIFSIYLASIHWLGDASYNANLYTWASGGDLFKYSFSLGFLVDGLSVVMLLVVNFISLLVHVYSMGYMAEDPGYQRFFSYISLFTFAMLMLVLANNFLQLFFGWEGVGLVSYLLIGFWFNKESAIQGNLKAFLVNRVGDFGFILGISLILAYVGSLDYATVFAKAPSLATQSIHLLGSSSWSLMTVICILLFIGAMGKSAQVPLHIWLPESMEGPTPISALIHAATMVTAGVFMVARMSPLYELSDTALSMILIIGATGALFTGLIAIVMNDIKRVVAYSTLSQLGYMMVAMGVSAYNVGIFHLVTHACFKAVLFLAAGSVIIGLHHEQDMRKMGGLWKHMPITYATFLIGTLALCAIPPFAGFYSKDMIIDAAKLSHLAGADYAYLCVSLGAFVTAVYSFRALFLTFHGSERMEPHARENLRESPWSVCVPLILLAIPSALLGYVLFEPMLFNSPNLLSDSIYIAANHPVMSELSHEAASPFAMITHSIYTANFWLVAAGVMVAYFAYIVKPELPTKIAQTFSWVYKVLINKYGFDDFNEKAIVPCTKYFGKIFFNIGDKKIIDGFIVGGISSLVRYFSVKGRVLQSGYVYHYATAMVVGLLVFLCWFLFI